MAINQNIANKYAKSAFSFAKKLNSLDQFSHDLKKFTDNLQDSLIEELSNPAISKSSLESIINEIATKLSISQPAVNFLKVVSGARRIGGIRLIEENFSKLVKAEKKIIVAQVFSTTKLTSESLEEIKSDLLKKYPGNSIEIIQTIKKDILGGLMVKVGSLMIDASLKRQLSVLGSQFQSVL
jgi:F-type H+-transporting ATPase subunit delta